MNNTALMPVGLATAWRSALAALLLILGAIFILYGDTALSMVAVWMKNDTYAHGFIVLPISLWLVWRKRDHLASLSPSPWYPGLFFLTIFGFIWLLGQLAEVNVVPQFCLIFMVVFSVISVLGWRVAKAIAFPLLFLFFAVPFGEFTQPKLMEWTAKFTVIGLRLTGVPVYSEGQHIIIPSGTWSVVEACSGVRYLIASVTVGTLFAYLTYQSLFRRLVFVGVSVLVPIIANWGRAYIIVMLGHLSGNKLAVGVDHLIYGWLFFGLVIGVMFWIGGRWHESERPSPISSIVHSQHGVDKIFWARGVALVGLLIMAVWPMTLWRLDYESPPLAKIASLDPISNWPESTQNLPDWRPKFGNYAASQLWKLENDRRVVGLFVAGYRNQDKLHRLVSSTNTLVDSEDSLWTKVAEGTRRVYFNDQELTIRVAELRSLTGLRLNIWQWYWINGKWTSSDIFAKLYTAYSRLIGNRDDSAVIILYTLKDSSIGVSVLEDFVKVAAPAIEKMIDQTMRIE